MSGYASKHSKIAKISVHKIRQIQLGKKAVGIAVCFAIIGAIFTWRALATTNTVKVEAESGSASAAASITSESGASGGKAVKFGGAPATCAGPITITTGGTYTGCWQSPNPNTPAVSINTTAAVTILNSTITSKGHGIQVANGGHFTVKGSSISILNPGANSVLKGRWIYAPSFASADIENNDLNDGDGVELMDWTGGASDSVKFMYNKIRNADGRTSNGTGYSNYWDVSTGYGVTFQLGNSRGIANVEVAWNEAINTPGQSAVEDNFSFWMSAGTAASPIHVHDNFVQGSWKPDLSDGSAGTGFNTGDGDGSGTHDNSYLGYMLVENNVATAISNTCYGLSYGHDITVQNNHCVVSGQADWSGNGTDIRTITQPSYGLGYNDWNESGTAGFTNNSVKNNVAAYWNRTTNARNDFWLPDCSGTCTGNTSLKSGQEITYQDEVDEHNTYLARVAAAGIHIGQ